MAGICICRNKNKNTLHTRCNCDCDSFRFSCVSLFGNWISGFPYWVSRKNRADTWTKAERHSVEWADCSFFALRFTSASSKFAVLFIPPAKTHSRIIFACDFIRNEFEHFSGLIFSSLRSYCRCRSSHFFFLVRSSCYVYFYAFGWFLFACLKMSKFILAHMVFWWVSFQNWLWERSSANEKPIQIVCLCFTLKFPCMEHLPQQQQKETISKNTKNNYA